MRRPWKSEKMSQMKREGCYRKNVKTGNITRYSGSHLNRPQNTQRNLAQLSGGPMKGPFNMDPA